jgi:hypothetical protein
MRFSRSAWLGEIVAGTLAGTGAGAIGAFLFPILGVDPLLGAATGAVTAFAGSFLSYLFKWLWDSGENTAARSADNEKPEEVFQTTRESLREKVRPESKTSHSSLQDESHSRRSREHV